MPFAFWSMESKGDLWVNFGRVVRLPACSPAPTRLVGASSISLSSGYFFSHAKYSSYRRSYSASEISETPFS